jgi:hypothetical protein
VVYKAIDKTDGEIVAIKHVRFRSDHLTLPSLTLSDRSRVQRRRHPGNSTGDFGPGYLRQRLRYTIQSQFPKGPQVMDCDGIPRGWLLFGFGMISVGSFVHVPADHLS